MALLAAGPAGASEFDLTGILLTRGLEVQSQPSWLEGGFGRLSEGAASPGEKKRDIRGLGHLGLDWQPHHTVLIHAHGLFRSEPESYGGDRFGVTEGFAQWRPDLTVSTALRLRAGLLFAGTSRENVGPLWSSPYTLTFSALNSWIAEEVRPTGVEAMLQSITEGGHQFELGGSVYRGMDTAGTLLTWRGWAMHDRLSVLGETLPLPPIQSLRDDGIFFHQQDEGTEPLSEFDSHLGWYARGRWSHPKAGLLQAAYFQNGGDRLLYDGQYSWKTPFWVAGAEIQVHPQVRLIAEGTTGETQMGPLDLEPAPSFIRWKAGYVLLALGDETARLSARYDRFENKDLDGGGFGSDPNQETGHATTVALLLQIRAKLRLGFEYLDLKSQRESAAFSGFDGNTDARQFSVELRSSF